MPPVLILILFRPGTGVLIIVVDEKNKGIVAAVLQWH